MMRPDITDDGRLHDGTVQNSSTDHDNAAQGCSAETNIVDYWSRGHRTWHYVVFFIWNDNFPSFFVPLHCLFHLKTSLTS